MLPALLLSAARRLEPFDVELARETYLTAWGAAGIAGDSPTASCLEICRAVRALPPPAGPPRPLDLLLDGLALLITDGHAAATPTLQRAAKALADIPVEDVLRWGWMATTPAPVWDVEGMHAISARQVQLVRDAGALAQLPLHLCAAGHGARPWMGDFAGAASLVAEIDSVAAATGSRIAPYTALRLAALHGREAEAAALIEAAIEQAAAGGQGMAATGAHWAAAVLYNGLARYEEAASAAAASRSEYRRVRGSSGCGRCPSSSRRPRALGTPSSHAMRSSGWRRRPQHCGNDVALGIEARCRALLSDGAAADELYREAIDRLGRTRLRPELARAHLLYGEWLRREGRRVDAREQLRTAHDMLHRDRHGGVRRARAPRAARHGREGAQAQRRDARPAHSSGGADRPACPRRPVEPGDRRAAVHQPRTVEWHLRKVFAKLGINSRNGLRTALPGVEREATPGVAPVSLKVAAGERRPV